MFALVLLIVAALLVFWVIGAYNRLICARNHFKAAFSPLDACLKQRYELIPSLVEVAKGYMKHERETLEAVIGARNLAVTAIGKVSADPSKASAVQQLAAAEVALIAALGKMYALSQSYPDLRTNPHMMQLSEELSSTESKIVFSRQAYNDSVMQYNISIEQMPGSVIARMFFFRAGALL
ncbi:LemA family protein [Undibacterium sp. CY18W]|uniref:LemA family protein n=1 Tax=Undibacterium hunanense TaxID=2762292 RepID=A0ABR6ZS21_9BURK|nr:LemA family protein [Undibacterium hunanense]MBC3918664.1 LemA family protein [Undibacterium hunanense]